MYHNIKKGFSSTRKDSSAWTWSIYTFAIDGNAKHLKSGTSDSPDIEKAKEIVESEWGNL